MNRTESLLRNIKNTLLKLLPAHSHLCPEQHQSCRQNRRPFSANGGSGLADTEEILRAKRAKAAD